MLVINWLYLITEVYTESWSFIAEVIFVHVFTFIIIFAANILDLHFLFINFDKVWVIVAWKIVVIVVIDEGWFE